MKKVNRLFSCIFSLIMLSSVLFGGSFSVNAQDYAQLLRDKGFPESYINQLVELHKIHPRWEFEPLITKLDWQEAVNGERSYHHKQLIEKSAGEEYFCDCPKCYVNGDYVIREGKSWVAASEKAVMHYMDPRNFLDEKSIFQFESTKFNSEETIEGIETIIAGTWMNHSDITYKDAYGYDYTFYLNGSTVKYSQAIYDAARNNDISSYYLASKIVQEVGGKNPTAGGASGTYPGYEGIYNYYNIRANSGVADGLFWAAKRGNVTNTKCNIRTQPWVSQNPNNSLGLVSKGTDVKIIGETGKQNDGHTWYQVETKLNSGEAVTGYIRSDLVDVEGNADQYNRPWTNPYLSITNGAKYIAKGFSKYQYTGYLQKFNVNNVEGNSLHSHEYMANVRAVAAEAKNTYNANKNAQTLDNNKLFYIPVFYNMPNDSSSMQGDVAITNLRIYDIYPTRLIYTWDAVPNAVRYDFYIENNTKGTNFSASRDTNYADLRGLTSGNNYTVYVKPIIRDPQTGREYASSSVVINNTTFSTRDGWNAKYGEWYYDYGDGLHSNGWIMLNGNWFYFYPNAIMAHDTEIGASRGVCYLDSNGYMVTNSWQYLFDAWRYYGHDGYLVYNTVVNDGRGNCYIDEDGFLITNRWMTDQFGLFYVGADGYVAHDCWVQNEHDMLYLDSTGRVAKNAWAVVNGKWMYFDENGHVVKNKWIKCTYGNCYVNENGIMPQNEWAVIDGRWMYFDNNGYPLKNTLIPCNNSYCYVDENGLMVENAWAVVNGKWMYFGQSGYMAKNKWIKCTYGNCYVNENGIMPQNEWAVIDGRWMYFDNNGYPLKNTLIPCNNSYCYVDENGLMVENAWAVVDGKRMYFGENGYLVDKK